ncbi:hypothetical protein EVAR_55387_1 [Eumeta japonica]|uniref:Uncharacterized protein n=1 Tax=Eumeta variegata TaxID=151549 RepID=A0A4C1YRX7_EUMVA|nr:hypothetical protein EVAR_55387_1 [Eumeta japonica]
MDTYKSSMRRCARSRMENYATRNRSALKTKGNAKEMQSLIECFFCIFHGQTERRAEAEGTRVARGARGGRGSSTIKVYLRRNLIKRKWAAIMDAPSAQTGRGGAPRTLAPAYHHNSL